MAVLDIEGRPMPGSWIPGATSSRGAGTIIGWDSLQKSVRSTAAPLGLVVDGSISSEDIAPWLGDLDLVVIVFSTSRDERALLLASVLRECHAYKGQICASGPILPAEHSVFKACGFSMLAPEEGSAASLWQSAGWVARGEAIAT